MDCDTHTTDQELIDRVRTGDRSAEQELYRLYAGPALKRARLLGTQPADAEDYKQISSVTGSDHGRTVTVVFGSPFAEWQLLFDVLYPAHLAEQHGGSATTDGLVQSYKWFDTTQPTWSGGPYRIKSVVKDTSVTEVPNPTWYGAVKPALDQLIFRVITDKNQAVTALQNNEVQAIYVSPTTDIQQTIDKIPGLNTYLGKTLSWEHLDFNEKNPLLADKQLRLAIFTAIDRRAIIDRTIGLFSPGTAPLNNHMYLPGQPGYQDNITATGQGSGDAAKAQSILTAAGYTGVGTALTNETGRPVRIRCSYPAGKAQICELVESNLGALGIKVTPTQLTDLGGALSTGDFDLAEFAWTDAAFPVSTAQSLFEVAGGVDFGNNADPAMEALLDRAGTSTDPATVQRLINQADAALTADAYSLPLYQGAGLLAAAANIANIRYNAALGVSYNAHEWGHRTT